MNFMYNSFKLHVNLDYSLGNSLFIICFSEIILFMAVLWPNHASWSKLIISYWSEIEKYVLFLKIKITKFLQSTSQQLIHKYALTWISCTWTNILQKPKQKLYKFCNILFLHKTEKVRYMCYIHIRH
jgi:hypothetical protein